MQLPRQLRMHLLIYLLVQQAGLERVTQCVNCVNLFGFHQQVEDDLLVAG